MTNDELVSLIVDEYDISVTGLIDRFGLDSIVPGICTNQDCLMIHDSCEPDIHDKWCAGCSQNTVQSFLILMEVI